MERAQDAVILGATAFREGRTEDGIRAYEEAYAQCPEVDYLFTLASAREKIPGRCWKAVEAWEAFVKICGRTCDKRKAGQMRLQKARSNCEKESGSAGLSNKKQSDARVAELEGQSHIKGGRFLKGITAYERAYGLVPEPRYLFLVAYAYEQIEGRCADAELGWTRFLEACGQCEMRAEGEKRMIANQQRCDPNAATEVTKTGERKNKKAADYLSIGPIRLAFDADDSEAGAIEEEVSSKDGTKKKKKRNGFRGVYGLMGIGALGDDQNLSFGGIFGLGYSTWFNRWVGLRAEGVGGFASSENMSYGLPILVQLHLVEGPKLPGDGGGMDVKFQLGIEPISAYLPCNLQNLRGGRISCTEGDVNKFELGVPIGLGGEVPAGQFRIGMDARFRIGLLEGIHMATLFMRLGY